MNIDQLTVKLIEGLLPEDPTPVQEVGEGSTRVFPYVKEHDDVDLEDGYLFGTTVYSFTDSKDHYYTAILEYEGLEVTVSFTADESFEQTHSNELYSVISTVFQIIKQDISQSPKNLVNLIKYTPASTKGKPGQSQKGADQRDRVYQAYFKRMFPNATVERESSDTLVYLEESYKGKRTNDGAPGTFKAKITKAYGGPVTIEKAKKFKNRKNATPHDKRQANWFINFHSKNENIEPAETSGKAAPYGSGYKPLEETLEPLMVELTKYMYDQGLGIDPAPTVEFTEDEVNAQNPLGRTAYYDPQNQHIVLYITGRHPKDILRSFAHEMIHHMQNLEGRLTDMPNTTNVNEDDRLKAIEGEAYTLGNMYFRSWENNKNNKK
jgi:hypothetical protein